MVFNRTATIMYLLEILVEVYTKYIYAAVVTRTWFIIMYNIILYITKR